MADRAGLALPQDGYDDTLMKQRRRMLEANREAARYFHETLFTPEGAAALSYLQGRGLNAKIIRHFGLGCAPNRWDGLLRHMRQKGYSEAELVNANLARRSDKNGRTSCYDNFRNRMMIPIIDLRGNVIAFGGRVLDDMRFRGSGNQRIIDLNATRAAGHTVLWQDDPLFADHKM